MAETWEIEQARRLAALASAAADETERDRKPPHRLLEAMADSGLFAMAIPRSLGGRESDAPMILRALEEVSRADGSAGWCLMIAATTGVTYGFWPQSVGRAVYAANPHAVTCGVYHPRGEVRRVDGGYRVRGRWSFASACEIADWMCCGAILADDGNPRVCDVLFPASEMKIIDTWTVSGLRGTGSHDVELADTFVPEERVSFRTPNRVREPGPLYAFPLLGLLAVGVTAVAIGVARRAIDELRVLAIAKTPTGGRRRLADRGVLQTEVAQAEACVRSARAYLYEAVEQAHETAGREGEMSVELRTNLRLAATNATWSAVRATDLMYTAGGGTSNYAASPLQRCFRDVHAITQHAAVAPPTWELCGRFLLGLDADTTTL